MLTLRFLLRGLVRVHSRRHLSNIRIQIHRVAHVRSTKLRNRKKKITIFDEYAKYRNNDNNVRNVILHFACIRMYIHIRITEYLQRAIVCNVRGVLIPCQTNDYIRFHFASAR